MLPLPASFWLSFLIYALVALTCPQVGLAVDDIKVTLQKAEAKMIALQVCFLLYAN